MPAHAQQWVPCLSGDNPTVCENRQDGTPGWQITVPASTNQSLEGFASATSVNKDGQIALYISASPSITNGVLEVFRMGWYRNLAGARLVHTESFSASKQTTCPITNKDTGLVECSWASSKTISIADFSSPPGANGVVSGYYLVRLSTPNTGHPTAQSFIIFVVRDDTRVARFLMNSAVTTYQAYNDYGGNSLYGSLPDAGPQTQVSFDRPYVIGQGAGHFFDTNLGQYLVNPGANLWPGVGFEYPMVRFLERGTGGVSYDVKYATDIDLHLDSTRPLLNLATAFLSVGHDEYWSREMHDNLEAARDRLAQKGLPTNIAFFSGNSVFWIINVLPSSADAGYRVIETHKSFPKGDPRSPWLWQNCSQVSIGNPTPTPVCTKDEGSEQKLVGSITTDGLYDRGDVVFAGKDFSSPDAGWIFQDTGLTTTSRLPGMIGYEAQSFDAGYPAPPSQTVFGSSQFKARPHQWATPSTPEYRSTDRSLYQTDKGALVVSLGSPDWSLGLDIYTGDFKSTIYLRDHPAIPQMTRNILEGVGGLSHVPPQQTIGPGYDVTLTSTSQPNIFHVSWVAPAGRNDQGCIDPRIPWCDFVALHDVSQNDDDLVDHFKQYTVGATSGSFDVDVSTLPQGTYAAEYVTVDRTWASDQQHPLPDGGSEPDQLRTIWRAARSSTTVTR